MPSSWSSATVSRVLLNSWTTTTTTTISTSLITTFIIVLLLLTESQFVNSARIQTFTIYSELDSQGESESFTNNTQDLFAVSKLANEGRVKWKCIERGIWLEYSGVNYNFKNRNTHQYQNILHGGRCFPPALSIQSIRHIGHSDLELPGISLYKRENFTGEELYFDGTTIALPVSIPFHSFGFTGLESWTLYSGTDFNGEYNVCLQPERIDESVPKHEILDSQLIFHNSQLPSAITVGSIRRGCGHHNGNGLHHHGKILHPQTINKKKLQTPSLSLYSPSLSGRDNILYMDGNEMKLPGIGYSFISYTIVGGSNWTIYSGNEFNGEGKCLIATPELTAGAITEQQQEEYGHSHGYGSVNRFGHPMTYGGGHGESHQGFPIHNTTGMPGGDKVFEVGSIKRGCDTDGKSSSAKLLTSSFSCIIFIISLVFMQKI